MANYKKAWIIDDDDLFVIVAKLKMIDNDFADEIEVFSDGEEALKVFQEKQEEKYPDFIFLDINMNILTGWEFLEAVEPMGVLSSIDIHITSSSIDPVDLKRSKSNPYIKSFISKPITTEKLVALKDT